MSTETASNVTETEEVQAVRRAIGGVSDALDQGINTVLRQVIKGQLAVGDAETAVQDVRAAIAEAAEKARAGRKRVQLAMLEIVEAEVAEQLASLRAMAEADDPKALVHDRMQHMQETLNRQADAIGRLQDEQQAAMREALEPLAAIMGRLKGQAAD